MLWKYLFMYEWIYFIIIVIYCNGIFGNSNFIFVKKSFDYKYFYMKYKCALIAWF